MKYVTIGNGVAGTTAAANIRKLDSSGKITILTDEAFPFYNRIRLIGFLAGEVDEKGLVIHKDDWYRKNNIKLLLSTPVSEIDSNRKQIQTSAGERMGYDRLLLATGGNSFVPPIPGSDRKGVFTLRTLKDANEIMNYSADIKNVLLIGGGLLGLEAGNSLRKTGHKVIVAEFFPRLLPRQMDIEGAEILKAQMENMGFTFFLGAKSKEITGDDRAKCLMLEDGTGIECDLIIISAGIRPNDKLGKKLGLKINKGLLVNDRMETEIKDIYAAGDLIEHRGVFYGIWPASREQGEIAGINMAGGNTIYEGTTQSNVLKVAGIDLASAGDIDTEGKYESIIKKDKGRYIYKKLVIRDNMLSGCILYGDTSEYGKILRAIDVKRNIAEIRKDLEIWDLSRL
ncbi:MAG: FAD-dependent oxidoreductase [Thermodesulfovibrionia bacterium]|nr:MAG: FAD-dependent oxidoreductase [Thermodesulfovibrionia bacterium]